jgi:hypothetical protein
MFIEDIAISRLGSVHTAQTTIFWGYDLAKFQKYIRNENKRIMVTNRDLQVTMHVVLVGGVEIVHL